MRDNCARDGAVRLACGGRAQRTRPGGRLLATVADRAAKACRTQEAHLLYFALALRFGEVARCGSGGRLQHQAAWLAGFYDGDSILVHALPSRSSRGHPRTGLDACPSHKLATIHVGRVSPVNIDRERVAEIVDDFADMLERGTLVR